MKTNKINTNTLMSAMFIGTWVFGLVVMITLNAVL